MAPSNFRQQTSQIMDCFFYEGPNYETDSTDSEEDTTLKIATQLRKLGDHYDETVIQPLVKNLVKTKADKVSFSKEFSSSVETLSNLWVGGRPEVATEVNLLKATMSLALYVKNRCPEIREYIQNAVVDFVDTRLQNWIMEQGGWDEVSTL